jgi:O-antigen ligase
MIKAQTRQEAGSGAYLLRFTPYTFTLARILLLTTLLAAPLAFGAVVPWAWAALGLAASLGLFLWALGSAQQGLVELIWSPLYIPLAMFFLLGMAQYAARLTLDRAETRQALVLLASDLAFFFLAVQLFGAAPSGTLRAFGLVVLVFAGSMGLFAILQSAAGAHRIYGLVDTPYGSFFGPYVNRDHFAGLLEMLLPVAILYIAGRHRRFSLEASVGGVFAAALALASLLLSGSRGGLLALLAEIAIATSALRRAGASTKERRRWAMAGAITLLAGATLFAYLDPGWVAKRLGSVAAVDKTWADWAGYRKSMAGDALRMWRDHPVLGVGLGDFETAYPRYQSFPSDLWVDHAHNDYVQALAETGLVGALLILSALALFLRLAFRDWGHPFRSSASWIRSGAALGCCGMLIHSLWDFNLHIPANAAWFAVLAGIAATAPASAATPDRVFMADGRRSIDD